MKVRVVFLGIGGEHRELILEPVGGIVHMVSIVKFYEAGTNKPIFAVSKMRLLDYYEITDEGERI